LQHKCQKVIGLPGFIPQTTLGSCFMGFIEDNGAILLFQEQPDFLLELTGFLLRWCITRPVEIMAI
jgi:hypothetical protein